jgi:hypothetical protein
MKNTNETDAGQSERGFTLEELIRRGAQDLIQKAIEVEVQALLASFKRFVCWAGDEPLSAMATCLSVTS